MASIRLHRGDVLSASVILICCPSLASWGVYCSSRCCGPGGKAEDRAAEGAWQQSLATQLGWRCWRSFELSARGKPAWQTSHIDEKGYFGTKLYDCKDEPMSQEDFIRTVGLTMWLSLQAQSKL